MATRMTINGVSTCTEAGTEKYERFQSGIGRRIETVEVSLKTFEVVQCRGLCNENTEYHERIIDLVNKNANLIRERMKAA